LSDAHQFYHGHKPYPTESLSPIKCNFKSLLSGGSNKLAPSSITNPPKATTYGLSSYLGSISLARYIVI